MRARRLPDLPVVLLAAVLGVLFHGLASAAASGLPPTITMNPPRAGPGSEVEVLGLDFPAGVEIALLLTTTAGPVPLGTAAAGEGGYFRQLVTFPADITPGFWELRATAPNGAVAATLFEAATPPALRAMADDATAAGASLDAQPATSALIDPNVVVMLVLLMLAIAIGGAAAFVWYQTHRREGEPGMATGDDPIWSGAGSNPQ